MKKIYLLLSLLAGFSITLITSCESPSDTEPPTTEPKIEVGAEVTAITQTVAAGGGTVSVSSTDPLIDGLEISVPANSYPDARTFTVSYAPIKSHKFGEFFKPITPMITVSAEGGYADSTMRVKIPIRLTAGEIPIAFFYDESKAKLEPIPVSSFDASSITIMTKHFDVSGIASGSSRSYKTKQPSALSSYAKILISGLTDDMYARITSTVTDITTGYVPGTDDWEFVNNGSFLPQARKGHCAGQNVSSIWYFYEKKSQNGKLYGAFDKVNVSPDQIWEDNPTGYHMASALQAKLDWESYSLRLYEDYIGMQDDWTWKALVVSMILCKEPFAIGVYGMYQGSIAGHDLTAYRINIPSGKIYIADPNFPGNQTREIIYANKNFSDYLSGLSAASSAITFTDVKFNAKTAVIDWNVIGQTWNDVMVNKQNPGYPAYSLWVNDGVGYELTDGLNTDQDTLDFNAKWTQPGKIAIRVYDESGNRLSPPAGATYGLVFRDTIILKPGANRLGIVIYGEADRGFHYIDFKWITVTYESSNLRIDPVTMNGTKDSDYVWNAVFDSKPSNARYEWNFGDGTSKYIVNNDTNGYHRYSSSGTYTITLQVFDRATSAKLGEATATAVIGAGFEITSVVPDKISHGMPVTINGTGFGAVQGTSTVTLAGSPVTDIISWSDTKIIMTIPEVIEGACSVKVVVGGKESNYIFLTKMSPKITSINKTHAKPGEVIEIRGEYFGYKQGNATLKYGDVVTFPVLTWNDTVITAIVEYLDGQGVGYGANGNLILTKQGWGTTYFTIIIDEDVLHTLHGTNIWGSVDFYGRQLMYNSTPAPHEEYMNFHLEFNNEDDGHTKDVVWSGTAFSYDYTETGSSGTYNVTLSGTVSDDGTMIKTIHAKYEYTSQYQNRYYEYEFKNIPFSFSMPSMPFVKFKMTGPSTKNNIVNVVWRQETQGILMQEYRGTDWTSTTSIPEILISFQKR